MSSKTKAENESWQQHVASVILANNGGWEEMHQCNMASRCRRISRATKIHVGSAGCKKGKKSGLGAQNQERNGRELTEITNQVEAKRGGYVGEVGRKYIWA